MRSEAIGPRTWLLLAVAGWAVLAWLLALAGMGSRIVSLPDDPSLVQALPALPAPAPERLGPLEQYSEIGGRPVFASDRQPHPFFLEGQGGEQVDKGFDYVLTSVLITPRVRLAIVQSPGDGGPASAVRVKVGEALASSPAWRLAELEPRRAVFEGPEGQRTLELRVFDGQGGEAPTQLASAQPNTARPRPPAGPSPPPRPANTPPSERPSPSDTQGRGAPPSADAADPAPPAPAPQTTEQQMQAIRERIEARRRQMREQQNSGTPGTTK
ncbi:general secretion pathway protein GspN [Pseudoxanthomonas sp.]|uniref:general secretion pathway protein GspN n=1 Tax=Pseudoxanthomonas sp. TaxID=1871049 RepID=UPI002618B9B7|nr:general secretion pathway protein GspN [Pseudoxanthomonas sp.]WDS35682.1 MAG: general secretion pathway protein GspN [Pseudoxanthomonas sp.]